MLGMNLPVSATWLDVSSRTLEGIFLVFSETGASESFSETGAFFGVDLLGVFGRLGDC